MGVINVPGQQPQFLSAPTSAQELFFSQIANACASAGFSRSERLIPPGFPIPPYQVVFRYRNPDQPSQFMQVGPMMFSVNAVKPYSSWEEFLPVINSGLSILHSSTTPEIPGPINEVVLRYVDLFEDSHLESGNASDFVGNIADFGFHLPESIRKLSSGAKPTDLNLGFKIPLDWGGVLVLQVGDGRLIDNATGEVRRGVAMNTTVSVAGEFPFEISAIMEKFNQAHSDIREVFLGLTKPIHHLMSNKVEPQ
jgi:uncharacterized protein (TIGR04255 family)